MRTCSVKNCFKKHNDHGFCDRHSGQIKKYGRILDRTIKDKNAFFINGCCIKMFLYNIKCEVVDTVLFSKEDKDLVYLKWYKDSNGYASCNSVGRMHRHVLKNSIGKNVMVDHINGNKLDNRRENLRAVTTNQNVWNRFYLGVSYKQDSWQVRISANGKAYFLGNYKLLELAVIVRVKAEKILYGDYAHNSKELLISLLLENNTGHN